MRFGSALLIACSTAGASAACRDAQAPEPSNVAVVIVAPSRPTLPAIGATMQLTAEARDSSGSVIDSVVFAWASSDSTKVHVSTSGLVTAVALGEATITAATGAVLGATVVTVAQGAGPAVVVVTPTAPMLIGLGSTLQLRAEPRDSSGNVFGGLHVVWTTSDSTRVRVSASGLLTAVATGVATITATTGGVAGSTAVTVAQIAAPAARISGGGHHACALTPGGAAYCWGDIPTGWEYPMPIPDTRSPVAVPGGLTFQSISAGRSNYTCGLTPARAAYCWGAAGLGQLGDAGVFNYETANPWPVFGGLTFQTMSAGDYYTCGLTSSGAAYCWGWDQVQSSDSGHIHSNPIAVAGGWTFIAIAVGYQHTCGLTPGGAAYCWGSSAYGQLGDGSSSSHSEAPVAVGGGLRFKAITAGAWHTCGLTIDGAAYCWGWNYTGQVGDGTTGWSTIRPTPVAVAGGLTIQAISAGGYFTCALTTGGAAYCWGWNDAGQLGDGTHLIRASPVAVEGGLIFQSISANGGDRPGAYSSGHGGSTCALTTDGAAYCWGWNDAGQLGDGTSVNRSSPVAVAGGITFGASRALLPAATNTRR